MHAPGFYLHIATDECFLGAGSWHPEREALGKIRDLIAQNPEKWFSARDHRKLTADWALSGDSLIRPPQGYAVNHVALDDLKRKDFIGISALSRSEVTGAHLVKLASARYATAAPLMRFLCEAINVPY